MNLTLVVLAAVAGVVLLTALAGVRIIKEYQRGVVFRLGRMSHMKGPGPRLVIPVVDRLVKVDLRTVHFDVPSQELITRPADEFVAALMTTPKRQADQLAALAQGRSHGVSS